MPIATPYTPHLTIATPGVGELTIDSLKPHPSQFNTYIPVTDIQLKSHPLFSTCCFMKANRQDLQKNEKTYYRASYFVTLWDLGATGLIAIPPLFGKIDIRPVWMHLCRCCLIFGPANRTSLGLPLNTNSVIIAMANSLVLESRRKLVVLEGFCPYFHISVVMSTTVTTPKSTVHHSS